MISHFLHSLNNEEAGTAVKQSTPASYYTVPEPNCIKSNHGITEVASG
jgi:limonene-1,2-epoxide hydrolase